MNPRVGFFILAFFMVTGPRAHADVFTAGDILVGDLDVQPLNDASVLFRVNSLNGNRSVASGAGVGTGVAFSEVRAIAFDTNGNALVADSGNQEIIRVDRATGNRTVFSGTGVGNGMAFTQPLGLAVDHSGGAFNGSLYVADGSGIVFRVDPNNGNRTIVSGAGAGSGAAFDNIVGIAVDSSGRLIITDLGNVTDPSAVYRVDPVTGARTILSGGAVGAGSGTPTLNNARGVIIESNGRIDTVNSPSGDNGYILAIDPTNGARSYLPNPRTQPGQRLILPTGIALDNAGKLIVADSGDTALGAAGTPGVFGFNPSGTTADLVSNFRTGTGENFGTLDIGIAVVPTTLAVPEPGPLALAALGLIVCGFCRRNNK